MDLETITDRIPLRTDKHGVVRVGQTRVTLDSVVASFQQGATAEELVHQFPTLDLADVYAVIGYYLRHKAAVEAYLGEREARAEARRRQLDEQQDLAGIRERLLARRASDESDAPVGG